MQQSFEFRVVRTQAEASTLSEQDQGDVFIIEDSLGYVINFVARLFARAMTVNLMSHDVTLAQWVILQFLWANEGLTQTQLSRHVVIDDATMVRTIDRMERDRLVRRVRNTQDRRQYNILLTDRSRALRDVLIPCAIAVNESALQPLTAEEQQQLFQLLRRVTASLQTSAPAGDK